MGTRRILLLMLVLTLFVSQLTLADSECDFTYSNYALAVQMHDMGDYDRALKHYHCALEEDPDNGSIELLIDNVDEDIANVRAALSSQAATNAPDALLETPPAVIEPEAQVETPPVTVEAERPATRSSWTYTATAVAVEHEFALALDQRSTMILPVATLTLEAGEDDVPMLSLESLRYLRYDSLEALRVYSWSRSTIVTEVAAESFGGGAMLWLHNRQRHESFQTRSAWKSLAVSDVTETVNNALAEATSVDGAQPDGMVLMPGVYASTTSLRMRERLSLAALNVHARGERALAPTTESADDHIQRARADIKAGDWESARDSFERALQIDPTRDRARCELGLVYGQLGDARADRYQHGCWRIMSSLP